MAGINAGILTDALPLSTEDINMLEERVVKSSESFAYLDEASRLCFVSPTSAEGLKDLAWSRAYQIVTQADNTLLKREAKKASAKSYTIDALFGKKTLVETWQRIDGFKLVTVDDKVLLDTNGLILTIKETK